MARARNPKRDEARKLYEESGGTARLTDIAETIGVPAVRIRKWKGEDDWDGRKKRTDSQKVRFPIGTHGEPGSGKERGSFGGGDTIGTPGAKTENASPKARPRNTNAVKTGEYQTIWMDQLSEDEKAIFLATPTDPVEAFDHEIRKLEIRELRMTKLLNELKAQREALRGKEGEGDLLGTTSKTVTRRGENGTGKQITTQRRVTDNIINIENAITRVQEKKLHTIDAMHRILKERNLYNTGETSAYQTALDGLSKEDLEKLAKLAD